MSWRKRLKQISNFPVDLFVWFWFGNIPPWWAPFMDRVRASWAGTANPHGVGEQPQDIGDTRVLQLRDGHTAVLTSRRNVVPVSPAAPTSQMVLTFDAPPPVSKEVVTAAASAEQHGIDAPTQTLRVIGGGVDNPCAVCGAESTSVLLDRCSDHDTARITGAAQIPEVHPLGRVTEMDSGEFAVLLEKEFAALISGSGSR